MVKVRILLFLTLFISLLTPSFQSHAMSPLECFQWALNKIVPGKKRAAANVADEVITPIKVKPKAVKPKRVVEAIPQPIKPALVIPEKIIPDPKFRYDGRRMDVPLIRRFEPVADNLNEYVAVRNVKAHSKITQKNFDDIFTNISPHDGKVYYAKGVSYQTETGDYALSFWKTGDGKVGNNIHHRDAFLASMEENAAALERAGNVEGYVKLADEIEVYRAAGRNQSSFTPGMLERGQGYQFTVESVKGRRAITHIDIDSSITASQISRKVFPTEKQIVDSFDVVLKNIDPSKLNINTFRYKGLSQMYQDNVLDARTLGKIMRERLKKYFPNGHVPPIESL